MTIDEWWMSLSEAYTPQPLRARFQPLGFIGLQAGGEASLSLFKQTEYIHSTFDVGRSMFDVHQFLFRFDRPVFCRRRG
jgi:hypothetical protein